MRRVGGFAGLGLLGNDGVVMMSESAGGRTKHVSELLGSRAMWHDDRASELRALAREIEHMQMGSLPEEALWQLLFSARLR